MADTAVSDWVISDHARVRLIDASPIVAGDQLATIAGTGLKADAVRSAGTMRLAGVEIDLDPSYITYWRSPGEAGVPPSPSFEGSANLRRATVLFPAPTRFDEEGSQVFGYDGTVVFPILVEPIDGSAPTKLRLGLDFAVCSKLCLPGHANLDLVLTGGPTGPEADLVRDSLRRVPRVTRLGESGMLAVTAVTSTADGWQVTARSPDPSATLFAEAPDGWFVQAGPASPAGGDQIVFPVKILSRPDEAKPATLPVKLTLVAGDAAIEVDVDLDVTPVRP